MQCPAVRPHACVLMQCWEGQGWAQSHACGLIPCSAESGPPHLYERGERSVKPQLEELLLSSDPSSSSSPSGCPLPPPRGLRGEASWGDAAVLVTWRPHFTAGVAEGFGGRGCCLEESAACPEEGAEEALRMGEVRRRLRRSPCAAAAPDASARGRPPALPSNRGVARVMRSSALVGCSRRWTRQEYRGEGMVRMTLLWMTDVSEENKC